MTIKTDRLLLRAFAASDLDSVHSYACDSEVTRYTSFGPNTPEETRDFLDRCGAEASDDPRATYSFAVTLLDSGELIGGTGFRIDYPQHRGAELGYVLHRAAWGEGYASEAAAALLGFAFQHVGLHRVVARCHPDNAASARVMEKIGMRHEGRQRDVMWMKGAWWDFLVYSILEHEWKERSGAADSDLII
jgi:[ribosomal protein S5]-alanine N-acetyltransferase